MRLKQGIVIAATLGTLVPSVYSQTANIPVVDNSTDAPVVNRTYNTKSVPSSGATGYDRPQAVVNPPGYPMAQNTSVVGPGPASVPGSPASRPQGPADLLYQLELLQQEVQQLRGIVEQQAYELDQMRIEQRDRYLDLDRRIGMAGRSGAPADGNDSPASSDTSPGDTNVLPRPATQNERSAYQSAFELIRGKKYDQAIDALLKFTRDFPDGDYTGNAFYWLGEVYLVKADRESALTAFGALLNQFPQHRKAADAKYKLGKIYRDLGDDARAKQLFEEVTREHAGTSAAKLAANELR